MKKAFGIAAAVFALFATGCKSTDLAESGANFVYVELESNPTTGFSWECEIEDASVVVLSEQKYSPFETEEGETGVGGVDKFEFLCKKQGESNITFTYRRPWENKDDDEEPGNVVRKAKITVNENNEGSIEFEGQ